MIEQQWTSMLAAVTHYISPWAGKINGRSVSFRTAVSAVTKRLNVSAWGACCYTLLYIFMSMRSAFKWPKITTSHLYSYQETLGTSQTGRTFHQRYQVSNCMCKKQHVCHYACAKGLETLKFDFQRPQRWLKAKCKKKETVRKSIKHSPSVPRKPLIWWPNTFCLTYSLLLFFDTT